MSMSMSMSGDAAWMMWSILGENGGLLYCPWLTLTTFYTATLTLTLTTNFPLLLLFTPQPTQQQYTTHSQARHIARYVVDNWLRVNTAQADSAETGGGGRANHIHDIALSSSRLHAVPAHPFLLR